MTEILSVKNLSRRFVTKRLWRGAEVFSAVRNVSFNASRGEIVGVVGESGCGKSTLARLILRLIEPSSGEIFFEGSDLASFSKREMRRSRQKMQMVFQDPYSSIDPRFTIQSALLEPFKVQGQLPAKPDQRVLELLNMVGLDASFAHRYPHQMSGGQKQRVGIARALALNPSLIVLDEPTASLDVSVQAQIINLLDQLRRDLGLTYIFISHDLSLVRYFCDKTVVMYAGRIVEILPKRGTPAHPYTRMLMSSVFEPDPKSRRTITRLAGEAPSGYALPVGCAFATRCAFATQTCNEADPALEPFAQRHQVACHHAKKCFREPMVA
ncbi:peptide ABC transporter ATP-binding protein [Ensifer sp. Root31]|uniref:ABC transporter ATP-binding protein n=1 Tax=Ensifer sp. Root31 TaxID=1736512 RepID=UPI00070B28F8|nr:ABC transporter ATP-binding protein [Ensifer sp. Root31]KQU86325.1 peptide ABC transporter ATP-binding protein [Ensifer sp. Root31]